MHLFLKQASHRGVAFVLVFGCPSPFPNSKVLMAKATKNNAYHLPGRMLGSSSATPEEVAAAAFDCATKQQQTEINVGPVFNGAIQGYKLTGFNPFALAP
eukprot:1147996-Pelagomonas_calceolata.AAC.6